MFAVDSQDGPETVQEKFGFKLNHLAKINSLLPSNKISRSNILRALTGALRVFASEHPVAKT